MCRECAGLRAKLTGLQEAYDLTGKILEYKRNIIATLVARVSELQEDNDDFIRLANR